MLNVNVPNVEAPTSWPDCEPPSLASVGAVQAVLAETGEGYVKLDYEAPAGDLEPGTDVRGPR